MLPTAVVRSSADRDWPYTEGMAFERISVDHRVMGGVPCIEGTRIPVATVVSLVAEGQSTAEIIADFPQLSDNDVRAALLYAAEAMRERELPLLRPSA
jgi:uncharacterized protein (DUF433 family)